MRRLLRRRRGRRRTKRGGRVVRSVRVGLGAEEAAHKKNEMRIVFDEELGHERRSKSGTHIEGYNGAAAVRCAGRLLRGV